MPNEGSITSKDLAGLVGIDESAIGEVAPVLVLPGRVYTNCVAARALRLSVMFGIGQETAPSTFAHNDKSRIYLKGGAVEFFRIW